MGVPISATIGQRNRLKGDGSIPAGVYESPEAILPAQADYIVSYFSRAGMPESVIQIDQYVSFDGGETWESAGGVTLIGGPITLRSGIISKENEMGRRVPPERGQPRFYKAVITTTDPHDITIDIKPDQRGVPEIAPQLGAGMG